MHRNSTFKNNMKLKNIFYSYTYKYTHTQYQSIESIHIMSIIAEERKANRIGFIIAIRVFD